MGGTAVKKRKPLPRPAAPWAPADGRESADLAEWVLMQAEQWMRVVVRAEQAEARLRAMHADEPGYDDDAREFLALLDTAKRMRAALLENLRVTLGHAERDITRDTAAAEARRRAGIVYRKAFAEALAAVRAATLPVTVANLRAKWPAHSSTPVDSTIRGLMDEHDSGI